MIGIDEVATKAVRHFDSVMLPKWGAIVHLGYTSARVINHSSPIVQDATEGVGDPASAAS